MTTRILQIIPTLDRGGAEKQLSLIAEGLPRDEFDVHVCALTRGGPLLESLQSADIPVTIIGKRWKIDPGALWRLQRHVRKLAPDVVLDMIAYTEQVAKQTVGTFRGKTKRLVVISSADVYRNYGRLRRVESGPPDPGPLSEDSPLRTHLYPYRSQASDPNDWIYNYEKILVERAVLAEPSLQATILRLPAVYGPGDSQHRLLPYLKRMNDNWPAILLEKNQAKWRWSWGYVEEVARAIAKATLDERAGGHIYNVGEPRAITVADWIRLVAGATDWHGDILSLPKEQMPAHLLTDFDWSCHLETDTHRIRKQLNYVERTTRGEAIRRTIDWERTRPPNKSNKAEFDYASEDAALARLERIAD